MEALRNSGFLRHDPGDSQQVLGHVSFYSGIFNQVYRESSLKKKKKSFLLLNGFRNPCSESLRAMCSYGMRAEQMMASCPSPVT